MNFFERRRWKKQVDQLVHDARHVRNMKGDIAKPEQLETLQGAERGLTDAWKRRDAAELEAASERINAAIAAIYPAVRFPRIRENVEVFVVALAVAMAFRTYFIQPFKIPTGSMQPTLYGITIDEQSQKTAMDRFPLNMVSLALFGERYVEVKAATSGEVRIHEAEYDRSDDSFVFYVSGIPHRVRRGMMIHFKPGERVSRGQLLASGRMAYGDHIFVDKIRYNFAKPKRGDIFVFSTDDIDYPGIRPNSFYIKRLAATPGEVVSIDPPHLIVDGVAVTEPYPFLRLLTDKEKGYNGYLLGREQADAPTYLMTREDRRRLGPGEYLPLGDNTAHSLDGRYFGPVGQNSLVGPAFMVYWPFTKRWGRVR